MLNSGCMSLMTSGTTVQRVDEVRIPPMAEIG
jgi:hypothetical protein